MVGADFDKINFKNTNWFWDFEWTEKQEDSFRKWLIEYLLKEKEVRMEIMRWPRKDKKIILKLANEFIGNYGWKIK